jgi:hypothetical protein
VEGRGVLESGRLAEGKIGKRKRKRKREEEEEEERRKKQKVG